MIPLDPPPPKNTRLSPRVPVHLPLRFAGAGELREAFIDSLSGGGVFVRTRAPLPIGSEVTMEISVGGEAAPVVVRGKVVWDRLFEEKAQREAGMGVRFVEPIPPALARLLDSKRGA